MKRRIALALMLAAGCGSKKKEEGLEPPPPVTAAPAADAGVADPNEPKSGVDLEGMDSKVNPGDDFFMYANGGWFAKTEIPADRSSYGTGAIVSERTAKRVADLVQEAAKSGEGDAKRVGDYYATFMDEAAIEAKGVTPLQPALDRIAAIKDAKALATELGGAIRADVDAFNNTNFETGNILGVWVAQDLADPKRYTPFLLQGGLGLPDRDYYFDAAPRMAEIRTKYEAHLGKLFELVKVADGPAKAKRVIELETTIAKAHASRTDSAEVKNGLLHWKRAEFDTRAPGMDWAAFFEAAQLAAQPEFGVWQPKAVTGIAAAVKTVPLEVWKDYLVIRAIDRSAVFLPKAFVEENFAFYGGVLAGTPKLRERWKRGVDITSDALGEAVGKLYVTKYFPQAEKLRAAEMVKQILAAFGRRIDGLAWMSAATKQKAKAKLAVMKVGVGYPDSWRDYGKLEIVKGDALGNAERAAMFEYKRNLAKLGQPVDRDEWVMTPHLVNAVNLPAMNAMNFPAGMLQPPYFDPKRPESMDYGAIGAVIGHEISHSFDDQGALFDDAGKLANWWTKEDFAHFKASSEKLEKQYNNYKPFPDLALNGKLTLGENIADCAGLAVAYDAYRLSLGGKPAPVVTGMSGDQQFFISFGQAWRTKYREPTLRRRVLTDGHSPGEFRADTVRNQDAWYEAFGVKSGQKLALEPADRVRIW
ncbi:MAG: M13 family metallopeptidase [Kofleriaceae bacterium]